MKKTRETLVYISMGTVNNDLMSLYRSCIEAFREAPYQVILSVGDQVGLEQFGQLPDHIAVYPSVDQIAVLEKADVFLTHCGMNSVSEALYHGVPLVMLPKTKEQEAVAARTEQLGAGLHLAKSTPDDIRRTVEQVLKEPEYREHARQIADGFHHCSGAKGAADKIESCCKR